MGFDTSLVVLSHLRWDFVFQRPQHLMTRLARSRRVFFVEEPILDVETAGRWKVTSPEPNIFVCQPHTPVVSVGFSDDQMPVLMRMIGDLLTAQRIREHVAWFYTPMAMPLLERLRPEAVVYDCMDALDSFFNAPPQLRQLEDQLLSRADVVFTGGPSLFRRMQGRHENVHCFPSSVDVDHFAQARKGGGAAEPEAQASLPHPRLGFFGVIDERLDLGLLETIAKERPEWQWIMVGPVVKIPPSSLPRRPNIHYFGQQAYRDLPGYLAGWDVCLLPFARNDATRYISPTKVLEYMASEKPIVSTPIVDVEEPYGDIVHVASTPADFIEACEVALASDGESVFQMRQVLSRTSWDETVARMAALVARCKHTVAPSEKLSIVPTSRNHERLSSGAGRVKGKPGRQIGPDQQTTPPVVIAGAGPTGLSSAYHLGADALLLEKNSQIGGWCRSLEIDGFTFDFAGHIMFSNDPYVHDMYKLLLGDNVHWQDREAWIHSNGVYTRYPFQGALHGLPPQVIKECIMGVIEARFGAAQSIFKKPIAHANGQTNGERANGEATHTNGAKGRAEAKDENGVVRRGSAPAGSSNRSAGNGQASCSPKSVEDCCGDGILESTAKLAEQHVGNGSSNGHTRGEPRNFEEFIYRTWGAGIAKHFAIPYNKKLWAVPLTEMETSWLGGRVPMPDLEEMIEGALQPAPKPMGPNARFGYPLRGGFQSLMDGFLPHVRENLSLNSEVIAVSPSRHTITLRGGRVIPYRQFISTMPLPLLVRLTGEEAPPEVCEAAGKLQYVSVRCVHIGVGRGKLTKKHWIYYPESPVFHRIFVQGNASPYCNPPGGFGLTCEITYSEHKPLPCDGDELIARCIADCRDVGIMRPDDPVWAAVQVDLPFAYVVYDHARTTLVKRIRDWLAEHDILLAGRYSEWEYYNSDHAFLAGKKAAEEAQQRLARQADPPAQRTAAARRLEPAMNPKE